MFIKLERKKMLKLLFIVFCLFAACSCSHQISVKDDRQSFKNFFSYFDDIIKKMPATSQIKDPLTKKDFENFKEYNEKLEIFSNLGDKWVTDAENLVKSVVSQSKSIFEIIESSDQINSSDVKILNTQNLTKNSVLSISFNKSLTNS